MINELIHDVRINNQKYKIIGVSITKTISSFTNTATITLPKRLRLNNADIFSDIDSFIIKKGDVVSIKLGYRVGVKDLIDKPQFEGFVSQINIKDYTVEIVCEDYMYYLKKCKFNFSTPSITLKALGSKITSEVNKLIPSGISKISAETNDIGLTLTDVKFEKINGVEILDHLKSKYALDSFFIGNVLHIGINYESVAERSEASIHTFSMFPRELIKTVSDKKFLFIIDKSGLNYQKKEDVKLKITAKIFKTNSEFVEKTFGDSDGEERTFIFTGNPSESEVQKLVENQLARLKFDGFQRGSTFTTFGKPDIQPLDIVSFDGVGFVRWYSADAGNTSKINVYKKSSYLVESVTTTFTNGGFRQSVSIAQRLTIDEGESISDKLGKTKAI
jgi:hypothetical protein